MCLGFSCRVLEVRSDATALVDNRGQPLVVSLLPLDAAVAVGDWILVHSGLALAVLGAAGADRSPRSDFEELR